MTLHIGFETQAAINVVAPPMVWLAVARLAVNSGRETTKCIWQVPADQLHGTVSFLTSWWTNSLLSLEPEISWSCSQKSTTWHQTSWSNCSHLVFYSEILGVKCWPGDSLSTMSHSVVFLSHTRQIPEWKIGSGHNLLILQPFQFIVH